MTKTYIEAKLRDLYSELADHMRNQDQPAASSTRREIAKLERALQNV